MIAYGRLVEPEVLGGISGLLVLDVTSILGSAPLGMSLLAGGSSDSRGTSFAGCEVPGLGLLVRAGGLDSNRERLLPTPILLASLISSTDGMEKALFFFAALVALSAAIFHTQFWNGVITSRNTNIVAT